MIIYRVDLKFDKNLSLIRNIDPTTEHIIEIYNNGVSTTCFKHLDGTVRPIYMDYNGEGMRKHYGISEIEYRQSPLYDPNHPIQVQYF